MSSMPDNSVDMILCDLPYGVTQNKWDSVIDFDKLWVEYWRVSKPDAVVVLTAAQPFTSAIVMSQIKHFKYDWIWCKSRPSGHMNAKLQPMRAHESILVFYRNKPTYNAIMRQGKPNHVKSTPSVKSSSSNYGNQYEVTEKVTDEKYPVTLLDFKVVAPTKTLHPTQKPVDLFEYLIRTYTNEGGIVLDNCAGSGTTAIACQNTNRRWVCIEQSEEYFTKAVDRIKMNEIKNKAEHDVFDFI